jgi:hypothetical protein
METISEVMVGLQWLLLVFHTLLLVLRMVEFFTLMLMVLFTSEMVFLSLLQTETLGLKLLFQEVLLLMLLLVNKVMFGYFSMMDSSNMSTKPLLTLT